MIRLIAVAFALAVATSAQAMPVTPLHQSDGMITQAREASGAGRVRINGVCVARTTKRHSADRSAGVRDGMEALAFGGTETPSDRAGEEHSGVEAALNLPGRFLQRAKFREAAPPKGARRTRRQHSCGSPITAGSPSSRNACA